MTRRTNAIDQNGDPVGTARYHPKDAARLLRFNVTVKRIADRCNAERQFFPWDSEIAYSTWHRALDGKPVWDQIVNELDGLYYAQVSNPRAYLPGPPKVDLFDWMKQIAGATWWVETLGLDVKANTLTAWMTRGGIKPDLLDDLSERVSQWWGKVDAACRQADMVRAYHAMERIERNRARRREWDVPSKSPDSFDSYFYTYVHEDGHTVDEARTHYVEMADLAENHYLNLLDLHDPKPVADRNSRFQDPSGTPDKLAAKFNDMWARGLDEVMPREMPEGTDLSDTVHEGQWPDRRYENGPWDANVGLHKLFYRERSSWRWDRNLRARVAFNVEVIAVSDDGQEWRAPTDRQRKGWDRAGLEWSKWLEDHGEAPDNQYTRDVVAAREAMLKARAAAREAVEEDDPRHAVYERARAEFEKAVDAY